MHLFAPPLQKWELNFVFSSHPLLQNLENDPSICDGLDVFENEPEEGKGEFTDVLVNVPNWVGTHHIGASTAQAWSAVFCEWE